jgi:hypothetical protein
MSDIKPFDIRSVLFENSNIEQIKIDDHIFTIKKNVKRAYDNISDNEYYDEPLDKNNIQYFFLFETRYHTAFGHWVNESAIFLPYIKYFDNCKLLINKNPHRKYKKIFIKMFGLEDKVIFYENDDDNTAYYATYSYTNIPKNNICILCDNFLLTNYNDNTIKENEKFEKIVENFMNEIFNKYPIDYTKTNENLFFPRNKVENYLPNDRVYNYDKTKKLLENKQYIEYDTMCTDDFKDQIQLLASSKNIFLDYGSSFIINSLFCKDSTIYVLNPCHSTLQFKCHRILLDIIQNKNNNKIIYY